MQINVTGLSNNNFPAKSDRINTTIKTPLKTQLISKRSSKNLSMNKSSKTLNKVQLKNQNKDLKINTAQNGTGAGAVEAVSTKTTGLISRKSTKNNISTNTPSTTTAGKSPSISFAGNKSEKDLKNSIKNAKIEMPSNLLQ
jgi:hypothetical protein